MKNTVFKRMKINNIIFNIQNDVIINSFDSLTSNKPNYIVDGIITDIREIGKTIQISISKHNTSEKTLILHDNVYNIVDDDFVNNIIYTHKSNKQLINVVRLFQPEIVYIRTKNSNIIRYYKFNSSSVSLIEKNLKILSNRIIYSKKLKVAQENQYYE